MKPAVVALRSTLGDPALGQVGFGCEAGLYAQTLPAPAVIYRARQHRRRPPPQ